MTCDGYILPHMETLTQTFADDALSVLFIVIGTALLYGIGGKIVRFFTYKLVQGKRKAIPQKDVEKRQKTLASLTVAIWQAVVIIVGIVSVVRIIFPAIDLSPLFASAGIVGVAVAFGSQALVRDFITGIFIVSENQYRVGDIVEIDGSTGKVEHLGTRSTVLRDFDGNVHYIPNGSITKVINKTMGYSRVNLTLLLAPDTDLDTTISIINQTGDKLAGDVKWKKKIIEAPQFDLISAVTGNAIEITITGKVQPSDQWAVTAELRRRLIRDFKANDIALA